MIYGDFHVLGRENFDVRRFQRTYGRIWGVHKDTFDRLLISTALAEDLTLVTIDESIHKYDVLWIW
jgi:PIN domain nuclease of toxin-antitoxin system